MPKFIYITHMLYNVMKKCPEEMLLTCKAMSLITTPPAEVFCTNLSLSFVLFVNKYAARGCFLAFIKSMLASILSTYSKSIERLMYIQHFIPRNLFANPTLFTKRMGSKGPKISSFMIIVSSGTSNKMVGAILLQYVGDNN